MTPTIEHVLGRLKTDPVLDLLEAYDTTLHADLWDADTDGPRLYRAFARALIDQGYPTTGLDLARRGLEKVPYKGDLPLRYAVALAYARGGNPTSADAESEPLLADVRAAHAADPPKVPVKLLVDVIALRGRACKDLYRRETDPARRKEYARQSAEWYLEAAGVKGAGSFPVVNAATMRYLQGEKAEARRLAEETLKRVEAERKAAPAADYWLPATVGEACVLLERHDEALAALVEAVERMMDKNELGAMVTLLGNLRLLAEAGATQNPVWLQQKLGSVVAFSGHRIDAADRAPRFPNDAILERRVAAGIRAELVELNARFGFCSLASGGDILFAEAMLARHDADPCVDLHVVLPFAKEDFLRTSVDYGDPHLRRWAQRFEGVLGKLKPHQIHYATTEPYLGSDKLFEYANKYLQGMAAVRAAQCWITPQALVVLDPAAPATPGGTKTFADTWAKLGYDLEVIDLALLRRGIVLGQPDPGPELPPLPTDARPRPIRAVLFADVAGFSKMKDELAPEFFTQYPEVVAGVLGEAGDRVLFSNTWGDGFVAVFETAADCARFAVALLDRARDGLKWAELGFKDRNPLRVGLHVGPVYEVERDPALGRRNFYGQHMNRTARIEPVTMPGCAYASEQFAALLTVETPNEFLCEFVGVLTLPKESGRLALYRVQRAHRVATA